MSMDISIPLEAKLKYIERRKKDLEACGPALKNQDFSFFKKIGHDLKGNAVTFGFAPLSSLGENLEKAAIKQDNEAIKKIVASYADYLKSVKVS